jgi:hypothetical protein
MKAHLTEQQLIEYQFKLASDVKVGEISGHLKDCPQCREHLERLQNKFAALDLLREDVKASEDLISKAVKQAGKPVRERFILFKKPAWLGAAAAVLLVGFMLLANHLIDDGTQERRFVKNLTPVEKFKLNDETPGISSTSADISEPGRKGAGIDKSSLESVKSNRVVTNESSFFKTSKLIEGEISDPPPFAPASAIELVVLPRRDKVQLTIYNSADLTLVRERRNLTLKRGWNWLQFMWANTLIDPTSLNLEPLDQTDKIDIQQLVFPARLRELGRWLIRSEVSGQVPFEITYFTSGLNWRAFYMGTLAEDEKTMQLQGYVRVGNNSGEDYENALTRLIVGKIHQLDKVVELARRQYPYGRPGVVEYDKAMRDLKLDGGFAHYAFGAFNDDDAEGFGIAGSRPREIRKEGLSEYFLYTIEGTETIADKWGKRLISFNVDEVPVVNLYKYEEERYGRSVVRFLSFKNDEEHKLGDTPIPGGILKVYRNADNQGHLSYTGQSSFKYIPVDEDVELNLGAVANVVVEPTLIHFETRNYMFDRKRNISGWDESRRFKFEVRNTREIPVKVEIKRNFPTQYWKLEKSGDFGEFEKVDLDTVKFTLILEPRSKQVFDYTLTTYHGVRQEDRTRERER